MPDTSQGSNAPTSTVLYDVDIVELRDAVTKHEHRLYVIANRPELKRLRKSIAAAKYCIKWLPYWSEWLEGKSEADLQKAAKQLSKALPALKSIQEALRD